MPVPSTGERFLEHLAAAIRIPTVADDDPSKVDPDAFERFRRFLEETYPAIFGAGEVETVSGHGLMITIPGTEEADPLILVAHQDVVPVEDAGNWSHAPFAAERTTTHLVGRGAIDDKGGLVAMMEAVESLLSDTTPLTRPLILALGHDEETMGSNGAATMAAILESRGVRAAMVIDEGGFITEGVVPSTRRPVALVGVSEKGYLDVELSTRAAPGHSSAPPRTTAVGAVAAAVAALQSKPLPARVETQRLFFESASEAAPRLVQPLFRRLPSLGPLAERLLSRRPSTNALIRTTTAPTMIEGGIKANVLPASARALVNFRLLPGDTVESVLAHVRSVVDDGVTVTALSGSDPPPVSDTASAGYRILADTITEVFPDAVVAPWIVIGATDARYYSAISDTVLRFLPFRMTEEELSGFHGTDERVRLSDAEPAVRFYRRLVERMCTRVTTG